MTLAVAIATSTPSSAGRIPQISRLRTSRPNSSVPSRWWTELPWIVWARSCLMGSYGATTGASAATRTRKTIHATASTRPGRRPPRLRVVTRSTSPVVAICQALAGRRSSSIARATRSPPGLSPCLSPDPGVEDRVGEVDPQVDEDDDPDEDGRHPLHDREVLLRHAVDQHRAHSGDHEDALDEDGDPQQRAGDQADHRDHRAQGVPQGE